MRGAALALLAALVLLPGGLAPDPDPFARCRGGDAERVKACIRDEVERRVAALPPLPEQAGPPLWLCDSPECRDRLGIACVLRPPSQAAYEARQKALEAWRRKQARKPGNGWPRIRKRAGSKGAPLGDIGQRAGR